MNEPSTIIPPTHRYAYVRSIASEEFMKRLGPDQVEQVLGQDLNRVFQEALGVDVPVSWVSFESEYLPAERSIEVVAKAQGPTSSREVYLIPENRFKDLVVAVTTESRIPIVASPYIFDNVPTRDDRYYTFQGWHAASGRMAFG